MEENNSVPQKKPESALVHVSTDGIKNIDDLFKPWAAPCFGISVIAGFGGAGGAYFVSLMRMGFKKSNSSTTWRNMHIGFVSLFVFRWFTCDSTLKSQHREIKKVEFQQKFSKEYYENPPDEETYLD